MKEEFAIVAGDGTSTKITLFSGASSTENAPVVICMPALGTPAKFYEPLSVPFMKEGWKFIAADLRGIGHSAIRASKKVSFGYHEILTFDFPSIIKKQKRCFPNGQD